MNELFEKASRIKLRFSTNKGVLSTEDLWDLSLTSLDTLFKGLNKQLKEAGEESLLGTKTKADTELALRVDLIKYVVVTKLTEQEVSKLDIERKAKKAKLMELIAQKQDENLSAKSIEELQAELNSI